MQSILQKLKNLIKLRSHINLLHRENQYNNKVNVLNHSVINNKNPGISNERYSAQEYIVSLTTYDKRLHDVYLTIESIMEQTRKANRIILWLSEEIINDHLPMSLQLQQKRGLEVRYCKDLRSYKKLIPCLKEFPKDTIITVDDDLIYDIDMLDKLIVASLKDPSKIYYNRGHKMKLQSSDKLESYLNWEWQSASLEASHLNFSTGAGGVLYPPECFDNEVLNEEVFLELCKYADDVWFKAMALLKGTKYQKVYTRNPKGEEYLENMNVQDIALANINNLQNQNDTQLKSVFDRYDLYKRLIN
jgi:hypothetical protein